MGADGFLRLDDVEGKSKVYITFDYTVGRKTLQDSGADVLITSIPDPDLEEEKYLKEIKRIAFDIFKITMRRKNSPTNTPY